MKFFFGNNITINFNLVIALIVLNSELIKILTKWDLSPCNCKRKFLTDLVSFLSGTLNPFLFLIFYSNIIQVIISCVYQVLKSFSETLHFIFAKHFYKIKENMKVIKQCLWPLEYFIWWKGSSHSSEFY